MNSTIRFKRPYRGREVGSTDSLMGYGVHDALVRRGVAEFCHSAAPAPAEAIPQVEPDTQDQERRGRRSKQKETD